MKDSYDKRYGWKHAITPWTINPPSAPLWTDEQVKAIEAAYEAEILKSDEENEAFKAWSALRAKEYLREIEVLKADNADLKAYVEREIGKYREELYRLEEENEALSAELERFRKFYADVERVAFSYFSDSEALTVVQNTIGAFDPEAK